jgi:hypothetical protein
MLSPSPELLLLTAMTFAPPLSAQGGREIGLQAIGTASDPAVAIAAVYGAARTSARTRLSASAGPGLSSGEPAFRGELLGHFLLSPNKRRGAGFYVAGGVAAVAGPAGRGYMVLTAGAEESPGKASGWAVELGVGGGVRLALSYRWRWLRSATWP